MAGRRAVISGQLLVLGGWAVCHGGLPDSAGCLRHLCRDARYLLEGSDGDEDRTLVAPAGVPSGPVV